MSQEERIDELKAFEAALASLVPRADRLDRDRLMFEAGRAAGVVGSGQWAAGSGEYSAEDSALRTAHRPLRWAWPASFLAMTAATAGLLIVLVVRKAEPVVQVVERVVEIPASSIALIENFRERPGTDGFDTHALGPLGRLRSLELAHRDANLESRELLDLVLADASSSATRDSRPPTSSHASYGELLRSLKDEAAVH